MCPDLVIDVSKLLNIPLIDQQSLCKINWTSEHFHVDFVVYIFLIILNIWI